MCCHHIYSGRQTCGCTSRRGHTGGRPHGITPPSFCDDCLNFYRERDSAVPFPRRPRSRTLLTCVPYGTGTPGIGIDIVQNLPKSPVPVAISYRTYRCFRYRYECCTELTEVSGTGIDVVPNLPKCPVPIWMSYRYRYRHPDTDFHADYGGICTGHTRYSQRYPLAFYHTFNF